MLTNDGIIYKLNATWPLGVLSGNRRIAQANPDRTPPILVAFCLGLEPIGIHDTGKFPTCNAS